MALHPLAETDTALLDELEAVLQLTETDMTLFYRALADLSPDQLRSRICRTMALRRWTV